MDPKTSYSSAVSEESDGSLLIFKTGFQIPEFVSKYQNIYTPSVHGRAFYISAKIYEKLMPHQRASVSWVLCRFYRGQGGLLADDMGLGKTVTSAVAVSVLIKNRLISHCLVCVPLNVMQQWENELEVWGGGADNFDVFKYRGTEKQRVKVLEDCVESSAAILICNYELMKKDAAILQGIPSSFKSDWHASACEAVNEREQKLTKRHPEYPPLLVYPPPYEDQSVLLYGPGLNDDLKPGEENLIQPHPVIGKKERAAFWDICLFDEAHQLKNDTTQVSIGARFIKSRCKILLSGTPVYNKLDDFWGLFDVCCPLLLGDKKYFKSTYTNNVTQGLAKNATGYEIALKDELLAKLKRTTAPAVLRRVKADLNIDTTASGAALKDENGTGVESSKSETKKGGLPHKSEIIVWQRMSNYQARVYKELLETETGSDAQSKAKTDTQRASQLRLLGWLRKVTVHPGLILPHDKQWWRVGGGRYDFVPEMDKKNESSGDEDNESEDEDELNAAMEEVLVSGGQELTREGMIASACKLQFLFDILPKLLAGGHKVLVFSEYVYTLNLVKATVIRSLGIDHLVGELNGTVSHHERNSIIADFMSKKNGLQILLASSKVGGVGLNLTAADRIILLEPSWTPAIDSQVVDRVHRIGQTKPVVIYRLVTAGTIEDHCMRLQLFKRGVHKATLEKTTKQERYFAMGDMRGAFALRDPEDAESAKLMCAVFEGKTPPEILTGAEVKKVGGATVYPHQQPSVNRSMWTNSQLLNDKEVRLIARKMNQHLARVAAKDLMHDDKDLMRILHLQEEDGGSKWTAEVEENEGVKREKDHLGNLLLEKKRTIDVLDLMGAVSLTDFTRAHASEDSTELAHEDIVQARRFALNTNDSSSDATPLVSEHNPIIFGQSRSQAAARSSTLANYDKYGNYMDTAEERKRVSQRLQPKISVPGLKYPSYGQIDEFAEDDVRNKTDNFLDNLFK